jgi:hypothetical protein
MKSKLIIFILLPIFLWSLDAPPVVPSLNTDTTEEDNTSLENNLDENTSLPPETPYVEVENNITFPPIFINIPEDEVNIPPEIPNVEIETNTTVPPTIPDVEIETNTTVPPEIPNVEIETNTTVPPTIPDVEIETNTTVPPTIPDVEIETNTTVPPTIPNVEIETNTTVPPTIPNVEIETNTTVPPNIPNLETNATIEFPNDLIDIEINGTVVFPFILPDTNISELNNSYISGKIIPPKKGEIEIIFSPLSGETPIKADVRDSWWVAKVPKEEKRYLVSVRYFEDDIETIFYLDWETFFLNQKDSSIFIQETENDMSIPKDTTLFVSKNLDYDSNRTIYLSEEVDNLTKFRGDINGSTIGILLEATNIKTGKLFTFEEAISEQKFGFRVPKDGNYTVGIVTEFEKLYLFLDENSSRLYSESEIQFDGDIPILPKYFNSNFEQNLSLDLNEYIASQYYVSGEVVSEKNITMSIYSSNGSFLKEVKLYGSSEFDTKIGRDLLGQELFFIFNDGTSNYCFDSSENILKVLRDNDWIGKTPDAEKFPPIEITSNMTKDLYFNLNNILVFRVSGEVSIPASLSNKSVTVKFITESDEIFQSVVSNGFYEVEFDDFVTISEHWIETDGMRFSLSDITNKNSLQYNKVGETFQISEDFRIDINLEYIFGNQNTISGLVSLPIEVERASIFFLDAETSKTLGFLETNSSHSYLVPLKLFESYEHEIIIKTELLIDGELSNYYLKDGGLISEEDISWVSVGGNWVLEKNSTGFFKLSDSYLNTQIDLDFLTAVENLLSEKVVFSGKIISSGEYPISIEFFKKGIDQAIKRISFEKPEETQNFETSTIGFEEYSIVILEERESGILRWTYNPKESGLKFSNDFDYFTTSEDSNSFVMEITPTTENATKIYGILSNLGSYNLKIVAVSLSGETVGETVPDENGNYEILLFGADVGDEVILKIVDTESGQSWFSGSNPAIIGTENLEVETTNWEDIGINTIVLKESNKQDFSSWSELVEAFESSRTEIVGTVLSGEIERIFAINLDNGKLFSTEVLNSFFSIFPESSGSFSIFFTKDSETYFYNPETGRFFLASTVNWKEKNGKPIPDSEKVGIIEVENGYKENLEIDVSRISNSISEISGTLILKRDDILTSEKELEIFLLSENSEILGEMKIEEDPTPFDEKSISYNFTGLSNIASGEFWNFSFKLSENGETKISKTETVKVTSLENIEIDLSRWGDDWKRISGKIVSPLDFNSSKDENSILLTLFNAENGEYFSSVEIAEDGNFSIPIFDGGNFIFKVSFLGEIAREFYLDFEDPNGRIFNTFRADEVYFREIGENMIADVGFAFFSENESLEITVIDKLGWEISGEVVLPIETEGFINFKNYSNGIEYWADLEAGYFNILNVKEGNYSVSIEFFKEEKKHIFFMTSSLPISSREIYWSFDGERYKPEGVEKFEIAENKYFNFDLSEALENEISFRIRGEIADANFTYGEIFVPNTSINYRFTDFDLEIPPRNDYFLLLNINNREYFYNNSEILESDVEWFALDSNGSNVCPVNGTWNCNWEHAQNWIWYPEVSSFSISADRNLSLQKPVESRISAQIELGIDFANESGTISLYQWNGEFSESYDFQTLENGVLPISFFSGGGIDWRFEISNSLFHFAITEDSLIRNENSWNGLNPKSETLHDFSTDLDFGTIALPKQNSVKFSILNLDEKERISIRLKDEDGNNFDELNSKMVWSSEVVSDSVNFLVPNGKYKISLYPENHDSGFVTEIIENNISDFGWENEPILIEITSEREFILELPSNADLKTLSGTVELFDGNFESGWVEVWNEDTRKGGVVSENGDFQISGLKPSSDYQISFTSWEFEGYTTSENLGAWIVGDYQNFDFSNGLNTWRIYGSISGVDENMSGGYAILSHFEETSEEWIVVSKRETNGDFEFQRVPEVTGATEKYIVMYGIAVEHESGGKSFKIYNATTVDEEIIENIGERNETISIEFSISGE